MSRNFGSTELKRLHRSWRRRTDARLSLVLDGVQGPFNVGAMIRTAASQRVERIWYANGATGPDNPKVGKTALGTDRYLDHRAVPTATVAIAEAVDAGYRAIGVELAEEATALHEMDLTGDVCLVIGHEDRGLATDTIAACHSIGYIPQLGKVGSLNVATAASVAMYEVRRQGWPSA